MSIREEVRTILNKASRENKSDTPDYILADYLMGCLIIGEKLINDRESYYSLKTIIKPEEKGQRVWKRLGIF